MKTAKDITGSTYNRLMAISFHHKDEKGKHWWSCLCSCGKNVIVEKHHLVTGHTRSCGCYKREQSRIRGKLLYTGERNVNWGKRGAETGRWSGGRRVNGKGYVAVYKLGHPRTNHCYVLEHILVMEKMLGRFLAKGEVVHHCNKDKTDNRPYNLRLFASNNEHMAFHHKMHDTGCYCRYGQDPSKCEGPRESKQENHG